MKKLDVKITKAEITSYSVEMADEIPSVNAIITCYTETGKKITTFSVTTETWGGSIKFDLPMSMIQPIVDIAKKLEDIVIRECNKELALIEAPK